MTGTNATVQRPPRSKTAVGSLIAWGVADMIGTGTIAALVAIGVSDTDISRAGQILLLVGVVGAAAGFGLLTWWVGPNIQAAREQVAPERNVATTAEVAAASAAGVAAIEGLRAEVAGLRAEVERLNQPWWKRWR